MNPGIIWWNQIGSCLQLLSELTSRLKNGDSAVLCTGNGIPWRVEFYETVDRLREPFSGNRRLKRIPWRGGMAPGAFVLRECCSAAVQADYWPGQSHGEYLGSRGDLLLCDYYVWVTGIRQKSDLKRWSSFLSDYDKASRGLEQRAVFILEYEGPADSSPGRWELNLPVEHYDCMLFSLEASKSIRPTCLRQYAAELSAQIGSGNPELCAALLEQGEAFVSDPVASTNQVIRSKGFVKMREETVCSAVWKASIIVLFPILEQMRLDCIRNNYQSLLRQLPINNSNGERVDDPYDLELGALYYLSGSKNDVMSLDDRNAVILCRRVRNALAHNKIPEFDDIVKVLS